MRVHSLRQGQGHAAGGRDDNDDDDDDDDNDDDDDGADDDDDGDWLVCQRAAGLANCLVTGTAGVTYYLVHGEVPLAPVPAPMPGVAWESGAMEGKE